MDPQIQQIIDRFTTAHGYNRWLDASELEQLLNNFVEELRKAGLLMPTLSAGALALCQERERQITQKGFTAQHDHLQPLFGFVQAALYYTECGFFAYRHRNDSDCIERMVSDNLRSKDIRNKWPFVWDKAHRKPSNNAIFNFTKAGALLAATIDKLMDEEAFREWYNQQTQFK